MTPTVYKTMPCGWTRTGKAREHLNHYRACNHAERQKRLAAWEALLVKFKKENKR